MIYIYIYIYFKYNQILHRSGNYLGNGNAMELNISSCNNISPSLDIVSKSMDTENSKLLNLVHSSPPPNLDQDNRSKVENTIASQDREVVEEYLETLL